MKHAMNDHAKTIACTSCIKYCLYFIALNLLVSLNGSDKDRSGRLMAVNVSNLPVCCVPFLCYYLWNVLVKTLSK